MNVDGLPVTGSVPPQGVYALKSRCGRTDRSHTHPRRGWVTKATPLRPTGAEIAWVLGFVPVPAVPEKAHDSTGEAPDEVNSNGNMHGEPSAIEVRIDGVVGLVAIERAVAARFGTSENLESRQAKKARELGASVLAANPRESFRNTQPSADFRRSPSMQTAFCEACWSERPLTQRCPGSCCFRELRQWS